jgi:hypothetical protein
MFGVFYGTGLLDGDLKRLDVGLEKLFRELGILDPVFLNRVISSVGNRLSNPMVLW